VVDRWWDTTGFPPRSSVARGISTAGDASESRRTSPRRSGSGAFFASSSARPHPAVVLTQRGEERGTEGDLAIAAALTLFDTEHHALAIDVADFELARFATTQAGTVEGEQQRAVIEILRACDQALDLVRAEYDR
jgi:hypothetical protein